MSEQGKKFQPVLILCLFIKFWTFYPAFVQKSHYKNIVSVILRLRMNLAKINQTDDNTASAHAANNK